MVWSSSSEQKRNEATSLPTAVSSEGSMPWWNKSDLQSHSSTGTWERALIAESNSPIVLSLDDSSDDDESYGTGDPSDSYSIDFQKNNGSSGCSYLAGSTFDSSLICSKTDCDSVARVASRDSDKQAATKDAREPTPTQRFYDDNVAPEESRDLASLELLYDTAIVCEVIQGVEAESSGINQIQTMNDAKGSSDSLAPSVAPQDTTEEVPAPQDTTEEVPAPHVKRRVSLFTRGVSKAISRRLHLKSIRRKVAALETIPSDTKEETICFDMEQDKTEDVSSSLRELKMEEGKDGIEINIQSSSEEGQSSKDGEEEARGNDPIVSHSEETINQSPPNTKDPTEGVVLPPYMSKMKTSADAEKDLIEKDEARTIGVIPEPLSDIESLPSPDSDFFDEPDDSLLRADLFVTCCSLAFILCGVAHCLDIRTENEESIPPTLSGEAAGFDESVQSVDTNDSTMDECNENKEVPIIPRKQTNEKQCNADESQILCNDDAEGRKDIGGDVISSESEAGPRSVDDDELSTETARRLKREFLKQKLKSLRNKREQSDKNSTVVAQVPSSSAAHSESKSKTLEASSSEKEKEGLNNVSELSTVLPPSIVARTRNREVVTPPCFNQEDNVDPPSPSKIKGVKEPSKDTGISSPPASGFGASNTTDVETESSMVTSTTNKSTEIQDELVTSSSAPGYSEVLNRNGSCSSFETESTNSIESEPPAWDIMYCNRDQAFAPSESSRSSVSSESQISEESDLSTHNDDSSEEGEEASVSSSDAGNEEARESEGQAIEATHDSLSFVTGEDSQSLITEKLPSPQSSEDKDTFPSETHESAATEGHDYNKAADCTVEIPAVSSNDKDEPRVEPETRAGEALSSMTDTQAAPAASVVERQRVKVFSKAMSHAVSQSIQRRASRMKVKRAERRKRDILISSGLSVDDDLPSITETNESSNASSSMASQAGSVATKSTLNSVKINDAINGDVEFYLI